MTTVGGMLPKGFDTPGNFLATLLQQHLKLQKNLIVIIKFMRSSFEVSSVAATELPKSCLVYRSLYI